MKMVALREICTVFGDGDWIESKDQSTDGIRLIQTGNVGNGVFKDRIEKARWISEETFQRLRCTEIGEGDVLISRLPDPVGRSCLLPALEHKAITAVDCSIVRFDQEVMDPRFFVYYSQSSVYASSIEPLISGSTRQRISRENLGTIQIPLLPLKKQREIVEKLDEAFADIDSVEANLQQSDERASELLDSILAAFFTKPEIGSETNTLVQQDIDLKIVKLSEVCSFSRGLTYGKGDEVEFSSNIVLRANNIDLASNSLNLTDLRYIKDSITIKDEKIAKKDSIIICTASGSKIHMGKVALIDKDYGYAYGGFMGQLTPLNNCLPKYLYFILISRLFKDYLMALNDGTNINNLKFTDIENYELPLPSLERQSQIVSKLDLAFAEVETMRNQIAIKQDLAKMLRQSLLSEAFSPTDVMVTA
jgi:type I restriction enzyme S subunit